MLGEVMFYGKGAGSRPTASAVVSDVISAVKNRGRNIPILWRPEKRELGSVDAFEMPYLVRVSGIDIEKEIKDVFGEVKFLVGQNGETAFVTGPMSGADYEKAASGFEVVNRIRIY